jgi:uncharacterized protein (TIGR02646 family)
MRLLQKASEPRELAEYRSMPDAHFDRLPTFVKNAIRQALVREQRGLCCYCMARVEPTAALSDHRMKIEHLVARSVDPDLALTWTNLLACCFGNDAKARTPKHCDTSKRDRVLTVSPFRAEDIASLSYRENGEIQTSRAELAFDITSTLNLNLAELCNNRQVALRTLLQSIDLTHPTSRHAALRRCTTPDKKGELPPFAGALEWWLRQRR